MVRVDLGAVVLLTLVICRVVLASCMSDKHELPCDGMMTLETNVSGRETMYYLYIYDYHNTNPVLGCPI